MAFTNIILEKKDGVAKITLNRPKQLNALDGPTMEEIEAAIDDIEKDDSVKVVVITGSGRAFSAGADLSYVEARLDQPEELAKYLQQFRKTCDKIESLGKPVIAAINGFALAGGLELANACDLAIASEEARIGDQHAMFGLIPGGGNSQRLPRLIGIRKAKELMLSGNWITPQEAERLGLVNKVVPADKLEEAVEEMAQALAERSPAASAAIKALVNRGMQTDLATALDLEMGAILHHFNNKETLDGIKAFKAGAKKAVYK